MNTKAKMFYIVLNTVVEEQPWGHKEFHVVDLHRNLLSFYEVI